ncbi:YwaF family protein [Solibacillus sp. FSL K6-1523]|uniref:YwaF family protein n=1 Tax=Solibacillus sp. FSL K6-1523 TaxID=2921471 RepID=UPI0030F7AD58
MIGFTLFDSTHIIWLVSISSALIFSIYFYKFSNIVNQRIYLKCIFWLLLVLECAKQLFLLVQGQYSYWSPPLHLCGLGIFITGWHAYFGSRTTATILYALTLPGAAIALIFPGWTADPVGSFLHVHSFLFHALLLAFIIPLLVTKQLDLRWQDLWRAVVFLALTVPSIYLYNSHFQTNFMFLNRPVSGTPLQWLFDGFGASGYLMSLALVLLLLWILMYLPFSKSNKG